MFREFKDHLSLGPKGGAELESHGRATARNELIGIRLQPHSALSAFRISKVESLATHGSWSQDLPVKKLLSAAKRIVLIAAFIVRFVVVAEWVVFIVRFFARSKRVVGIGSTGKRVVGI